VRNFNIYKFIILISILLAMFLVSKKFISIFSSATIPFVSGLETVKTHPVSYLAESNTTVLAINKNSIGKDYRANEKYINDLEPLSDFVPLFIRGVFQTKLVLHTSKDGNQATVIMTHDVDFEHSIKNMSLFTKLEEDLGFRATYNIQVKYMTDDKDKAFFLPRNFHYMTEAEDRGHEIGSHTIVHTKNFFFLPDRDCEINYPEYRPFSESDLIDSGNPTVCGETKVAKELLVR